MSYFTKFTTALCLASYTAAIELQSATENTTKANQGDDFFAKAGTDCMSCTPELFDVVEPMNNWTFQYVITTGNLDTEWANDNKVELVPMIDSSSIQLTDDSWCTFRTPATDMVKSYNVTTQCTVEMIAQTLRDTQSQLTVPMKYLMGWNEPYVKPKAGQNQKKQQKYIDPTEAAEMWRNVVQPAAVETGLKLVTPTTAASSPAKVQWTATFIAACWAQRDAETNPCDVNLIKAFSVHDYKCMESYWSDNYTVGTGKFQTSMISMLKTATADDNEGEIDWTSFVNDMPIWVQETSCTWDPTVPDQSDICKRITQQAGPEYGIGSIAWMNAADNIERWAWYTTFNTKDNGANANTRLINADGELLPPGRALMSELDSTVDCMAEPLQ